MLLMGLATIMDYVCICCRDESLTQQVFGMLKVLCVAGHQTSYISGLQAITYRYLGAQLVHGKFLHGDSS
jgi:hypothetical protein